MSNVKQTNWDPTKYAVPQHWSADRCATLSRDIFAPAFSSANRWLCWAAMASAGRHQFIVLTSYFPRFDEWNRLLVAASPVSLYRYRLRCLQHFWRYRGHMSEGYSFASQPTPELRHIYDCAGRIERRATRPSGVTLHCGFSGGEFHWRKWPLDNVRIVPVGAST